MAHGHKGKAHEAHADIVAAPVHDQVPRPPVWYHILKYFLWAAILAIAIGILAIMSQHLQKIPFLYDGPNPRYSGLNVNIAYCLLSDSALVSGGASQDIKCNVAISAAAVSIALAVVWIVMQAFHDEADVANYKLLLAADTVLCLLGAGWWIAFGVLISLWTTNANNAGLPGSNWRNGVSAMAWLSWLAWSLLSMASLVRLSRRAQRALFTKKPKQPKAAKDIEAPVAPGAAAAATAVPITAAPHVAAPAGPATAQPAPQRSAAQSPAPLSEGPHGGAAGPAHVASPTPVEAPAPPAGGLNGAAPGGAWGGASNIAAPTPAV